MGVATDENKNHEFATAAVNKPCILQPLTAKNNGVAITDIKTNADPGTTDNKNPWTCNH